MASSVDEIPIPAEYGNIIKEAVRLRMIPYDWNVWNAYLFPGLRDHLSVGKLLDIYDQLLLDHEVDALEIARWCRDGSFREEAKLRLERKHHPFLNTRPFSKLDNEFHKDQATYNVWKHQAEECYECNECRESARDNEQQDCDEFTLQIVMVLLQDDRSTNISLYSKLAIFFKNVPTRTEGCAWRLRYALSSELNWKYLLLDPRFKRTLEDYGIGNLYMIAGTDDFVEKVYLNIRQAYISTFDNAGPFMLFIALEKHSMLDLVRAFNRQTLRPESEQVLELLDNVDTILSDT
uniref:Zinc finger protein n=1 Tax=Talaromyces marneffei PM1 TaxID=1077442 RepID=A0A093UMM9_TALMA